ncbi:hypothetical protein QBA35_23950 [Streptomyces bottropensis]|uniref:Uncharacterized protein n=1 Tax=Streptomyces bottropensis TaxID=42235 RepID=A0ABU8ARN3_9ACTN
MNTQKEIVLVEFGETETLDHKRLLLSYGLPKGGKLGWWLFWLDEADETRLHHFPEITEDDRSQALEQSRSYAVQNLLL